MLTHLRLDMSLSNSGGMAAGVKGTPMPHRVPITVVMGKPFRVPHIADPTQEQVYLFACVMHSFTACHQPAGTFPTLCKIFWQARRSG